MRERAGTNPEIARQYREQLLSKLFGELYCGDEPMSRSDRYDKLRIKQIATAYLQGAGIELAKSGRHANVVERVLRGIEPEERHDIPGAVMAVVASEAMFRSSSVLSINEKQELYTRTDCALMQTDMMYHRGGWDRFNVDMRQRSELLLTHEFNNPNVSFEKKQELLALYDHNFMDEPDDYQEAKSPRAQEKPSLARRIGRYLLQGLGATAGMVGPTEFGHDQPADDNGDTDDDWPGYAR